jgi:hypothetical protein
MPIDSPRALPDIVLLDPEGFFFERMIAPDREHCLRIDTLP